MRAIGDTGGSKRRGRPLAGAQRPRTGRRRKRCLSRRRLGSTAGVRRLGAGCRRRDSGAGHHRRGHHHAVVAAGPRRRSRTRMGIIWWRTPRPPAGEVEAAPASIVADPYPLPGHRFRQPGCGWGFTPRSTEVSVQCATVMCGHPRFTYLDAVGGEVRGGFSSRNYREVQYHHLGVLQLHERLPRLLVGQGARSRMSNRQWPSARFPKAGLRWRPPGCCR